MPLEPPTLNRSETGKHFICRAQPNDSHTFVSLYKNYSGTYSQSSPDGEYCDCSKEQLNKWLELLPHDSPHRTELHEYINNMSEESVPV